MPRLILERHFIRLANKLIKKSPQIDERLSNVLTLLEKEPFSPLLKTHPLSGKLKGKYACSLTYDLRIIFKLTEDSVHILDIGAHDEVY